MRSQIVFIFKVVFLFSLFICSIITLNRGINCGSKTKSAKCSINYENMQLFVVYFS